MCLLWRRVLLILTIRLKYTKAYLRKIRYGWLKEYVIISVDFAYLSYQLTDFVYHTNSNKIVIPIPLRMSGYNIMAIAITWVIKLNNIIVIVYVTQGVPNSTNWFNLVIMVLRLQSLLWFRAQKLAAFCLISHYVVYTNRRLGNIFLY